jgi:hypothetical protein
MPVQARFVNDFRGVRAKPNAQFDLYRRKTWVNRSVCPPCTRRDTRTRLARRIHPSIYWNQARPHSGVCIISVRPSCRPFTTCARNGCAAGVPGPLRVDPSIPDARPRAPIISCPGHPSTPPPSPSIRPSADIAPLRTPPLGHPPPLIPLVYPTLPPHPPGQLRSGVVGTLGPLRMGVFVLHNVKGGVAKGEEICVSYGAGLPGLGWARGRAGRASCGAAAWPGVRAGQDLRAGWASPAAHECVVPGPAGRPPLPPRARRYASATVRKWHGGWVERIGVPRAALDWNHGGAGAPARGVGAGVELSPAWGGCWFACSPRVSTAG